MYFSSIIEYAEKNKINIDIFLIQNEFQSSNAKEYQVPRLSNSPYKSRKHIIFNSSRKLSQKIIESKYDFYFSLHPISEIFFEINKIFLDKIKGKLCIFMRGQDLFYEIAKLNDKKIYKYDPIIFSMTKFQFNIGMKYITKFKNNSKNFFIKNKVTVHNVGLPMLNRYHEKNFKYFNKIKKKLKFKKSILYLPCEISENPKNILSNKNLYAYKLYDVHNFYSKNNFLLKIIKNFFKKNLIYLVIFLFNSSREIFFNKLREEDILYHLKAFSDRNSYNLIIKSRKKSLLCKYYDKYSDLHIVDEHHIQNPTIIQQLIKKSSIVIGNSSSAVYEVVFNKKKYMNINSSDFLLSEKSEKYFYDFKKGSMYNFNGLTEVIYPKKMIENLKKRNYDFKENILKSEYLNYSKKFLGVDKSFDPSKVFKNLKKRSQNA